MIIQGKRKQVSESIDIESVTAVLLSYNGKGYLEEKINRLLHELSRFKDHELVVIDDHSTDGSQDLLLKYSTKENVQIVLKDERKGIPHTMNLAVEKASYDCIVFCDQRQGLSENALYELVKPLKKKEIAAVSGCLSCIDKEQCNSLIRKYENFIKMKESRTGNLIGVYGPLYAIKKSFYKPIPDNIILDDLYLSLRIIQNGQVVLAENCLYTEDGLSVFYNYKRAKRYLQGFLQILREPGLLSRLSPLQATMLFWHKYFRLLIPVSLLSSYLATGIAGITYRGYFIAFLILSALILLSLLPVLSRIKFRMKNALKINILYSIALVDILFYENFIRKIMKISHRL
jgi:glycosyltransferase involved in cell wall biosynthesis